MDHASLARVGHAGTHPDVGGERRLESRLSLFPLDRFDQRRLFSTDISSGASVEIDVEIVTGSTGVLADQTGLVGLVNGLLDVRSFLVEFSTDVDVGWVGRSYEGVRQFRGDLCYATKSTWAGKQDSPALAFIARPAIKQPSTSL